jgi:hypothetical protein
VDGSAGGDVAAVAAAGAGSSSSQGPLPPAVSFQQQQQQQQQQQAFDVPAALSQLGLGGGGSSSAATVLQPLDYGFVTTAATISAREVAGGRDKRWERSWEHAMVSACFWARGGGGGAVQPYLLLLLPCRCATYSKILNHTLLCLPPRPPRCATVPAGVGPTTWTSVCAAGRRRPLSAGPWGVHSTSLQPSSCWGEGVHGVDVTLVPVQNLSAFAKHQVKRSLCCRLGSVVAWQVCVCSW